MRRIAWVGLAVLVLAGVAWLLLERAPAPPPATSETNAVVVSERAPVGSPTTLESSSTPIEAAPPRDADRAAVPTVAPADVETLLRVQFVDVDSGRPLEHVRARLG